MRIAARCWLKTCEGFDGLLILLGHFGPQQQASPLASSGPRTALHFAASVDDAETCRLLIHFQAQLDHPEPGHLVADSMGTQATKKMMMEVPAAS